jgi:hypothetical protein
MKEIKWVRIDKGTGDKEYVSLEIVKQGLRNNYKDIEEAIYSLITKQVLALSTPFFIYRVQ